MKHLIILKLLFFIVISSLGQNLNIDSSSVLTRRFNFYLRQIKNEVVFDSIKTVNGDSGFIVVERLTKDTALLVDLLKSSPESHKKLIYDKYNLPFLIKPINWASDYEKVFTPNQLKDLDSLCKSFEKKTRNEIAIITLDSSYINGQNFDSLILRIHNFWKLGKINLNNGILIGISVEMKRIRINNGFGIEKRLSDKETKKIIDEVIIPEFKKGDYFNGTKKGVLELIKKLK